MAPPEPLRLSFADGRGYGIHLGPLTGVPELMEEDASLRPGACLIVSDENVAKLFLSDLLVSLEVAGWTPRTRVLLPGEASKSLRTLSEIYDWALAPTDGQPPDRATPLLALGGGVVGDVAGYAAATLLRGIPLVHLPTSLLAQVDSAIGGKTGVNHSAGKNLIGAVHQPALVVADPATLATLPKREWWSGMAEVVKAALIADAAFFDWLEARWEAIDARSPEVVGEMVRRAAAIKVRVVEQDEFERGRRAILNFGHTFAHAIERATGYLVFTHGEAVALGMRAALHLSQTLSPAPELERAKRLVERISLPAPLDVPIEDLLVAMQADKKRARGRLRLVVLDEVGAARLADDISEDAILEAWQYVRGLPPA
jgi:3-dehydroquinate synthase